MPAAPDRIAFYRDRATRHRVRRDELRRRSAVLARARLATFLAGLALLVWWLGFDAELLAAVLTVSAFVVFAALVVVHARVEDQAAWFDALHTVNIRGIDAIARNWDALPDAPPPLTVDVGTLLNR